MLRQITMAATAATLLLCAFSCSNKEELPQVAEFTQASSQDVIDWRGETVNITIAYREQTKAVQLPWACRMNIDGEMTWQLIDAGTLTATFTVPANYTASARNIRFEICNRPADTVEQSRDWTEVCTATQGVALMSIDGIDWAVGNLTVKNGKFAIAENQTDAGYFFLVNSIAGFPSEGSTYAGSVYCPNERIVALSDVATLRNTGDPCAAMSNGTMRMPSLYEMQKLFDMCDLSFTTVNGTKMYSFADGKFLLPVTGGCNTASGAIDLKNDYAAYWYSGTDADGNGGILAISETNYADLGGSFMAYNMGDYACPVRCVRNIAKAAYVSHSPLTVPDNSAFTLTVETTAGDMNNYVVEAVDGYYTVVGTLNGTTATIEIPENTEKQAVTYSIYINGEPTGKSIEQAGRSNYADYVSHTPTGTVEADAFSLTVVCDSDMNSFKVEVKSDNQVVADATASQTNSTVTLAIPANTGKERTLTIWVNGVNTNRSVVQKAAAVTASLVWSSGYLTVSDGKYTFAAPNERGMYFKYNSRYGLTINTEAPASSSNYSGTAYGPTSAAMVYSAVTSEDIDPCSLVSDGTHTWRMPTKAECDAIIDAVKKGDVGAAGSSRGFNDGTADVFFVASGNIKDTGTGMLTPTYIRFWTADSNGSGKYYTVSGGVSSLTGAFTDSAAATPGTAMMVRCVRQK